jgi:hypothetical protein
MIWTATAHFHLLRLGPATRQRRGDERPPCRVCICDEAVSEMSLAMTDMSDYVCSDVQYVPVN